MADGNTGVPVGEAVGYVAGAVAAITLGWRRVMRMWSADRTATAKSDAEADVVELLRAEVERLGKQNGELAEFANRLQREMLELKQANLTLHDTVNSLTAELQRLRRGLLQ